MITYNPNDPVLSFAVDPGTSTLGLTIVKVLPDSTLELVHSETIEIDKEIRRSTEYQHLAEEYSMMDARLSVIRDCLLELLLEYEPHVLSVETPYMGRFPAAYRALVLCMSAVLKSFRDYNDDLPIHFIEPSSAKAAVGVVKKGSHKDVVERLLRARFKPNCKKKEFHESELIEFMDEHQWDSLAVNYATLAFYDFFDGEKNHD